MTLRQLLDQIRSYVKNSNDIALMLNALDELDDKMFLFTEEETAIHPNINIEEGLMFLTIALDNLIFKIGLNWSRTEIVNAMKSLLRFNMFQFGDTHCRQK